MRGALLACAALLLGGCIGPKPHEPDRFFVLYPAPVAAAVRYAGPAVTVAPTTAAAFYGTGQIIYSDLPGTRARYRYSFWTEPPQGALYSQLLARLQDAGGSGRVLLETHIDEIYHDATTVPGVVRITVTARLEDEASHAVIGQRRFSRAVPAASFNAQGAVDAMRKGMAGLLDDIVAWVGSSSATYAQENQQRLKH